MSEKDDLILLTAKNERLLKGLKTINSRSVNFKLKIERQEMKIADLEFIINRYKEVFGELPDK